MGTAAFAVDLLAAVAADVGRADAREVLIEGESDVCHEHDVAEHGRGDRGEEQMIESTHAKQSQEIDDRAQRGEMTESVIN